MTVAGTEIGRPDGTDRVWRCAIHQPNFFPWLGYFDKIHRADIFVFMDDVDYPRSGSGMGTWCSRVKINVGGKARWFGVPVARYSGRRAIKEIQIADDGKWRGRLIRTLQMNYARAPNFERAMPMITRLVEFDSDNLAEFNINAITRFCEVLGVEARFQRQSELDTQKKATELLIEIARNVQADRYLCGAGADGYQEDQLFEDAGIRLEYQNFSPEPYGEESEFLPGLSIIDYLMNSSTWTLPSKSM